MYNVYVLISLKDYKFYIGFSENIEQRLKDHNSG
ncbi:MAG: GIY-YIG nuclease family protein, partial [Candidatus Omnitrophica bacterium]|nr:GIY-YIG nuclease family protein [Candidatus Omnitrophota bacterium]